MIRYITGDATKPSMQDGPNIIAHVVNDIGVWGAGFVIPLAKAFPCAKVDYIYTSKTWDNERLPLGLVIWSAPPIKDLSIANIVGQYGVGYKLDERPPIRYWAISKAFDEIREEAEWFEKKNEKFTVHAPRLGAGLAGGDFLKVLQAINNSYPLDRFDLFIYTLPSEVKYFKNYTIEEIDGY